MLAIAFFFNRLNHEINLYLNITLPPHTKHCFLITNRATNMLNLFQGILEVCSEIYTKYTNRLCGQDAKFKNVSRKPGGRLHIRATSP
jgi:hypothetical protein